MYTHFCFLVRHLLHQATYFFIKNFHYPAAMHSCWVCNVTLSFPELGFKKSPGQGLVFYFHTKKKKVYQEMQFPELCSIYLQWIQICYSLSYWLCSSKILRKKCKHSLSSRHRMRDEKLHAFLISPSGLQTVLIEHSYQ